MSSALLKAQLQRHKVRHERETAKTQQAANLQTIAQKSAQSTLKRKFDHSQSNKSNKRKKSASKKPIKLKPKKPVQKSDPNVHAFPSLPNVKQAKKQTDERDFTKSNMQLLMRSSKQRAELQSYAASANEGLIAKKFRTAPKSKRQQSDDENDDELRDDFQESDDE